MADPKIAGMESQRVVAGSNTGYDLAAGSNNGCDIHAKHDSHYA